MPHIIIDGQQIETAQGKTIIEAATENGIDIPHFCWHPGLSVAGNCRMCLVNVGSPRRLPDGTAELGADGKPDIAFFPKLQIACATPVSEGMVIDTTSNKTETAQNAIMEFLLINHPLDCPICDEAGQCKLQEYAFMHSKAESRFDEQKNHKDKRVPFGPNVMFDGERCISCSRCIRFADEVAQQPVLSFVDRGDHVTIETFPGTQFDSPYSMNVIDICPVGALTSIDFRFKSRVWEMSFSDSICPGCSRGCNVKLGVRDNKLLRLEPRTNMHVNEYWMCDHGRLNNYHFVNENRISEPIVLDNGIQHSTTWANAIDSVAQVLKQHSPNEIMFVGSPHASNEDNFAFSRLARELGIHNLDFVRSLNSSFADSKLRTDDTSPNSAGAYSAGVRPTEHGVTIERLPAEIESGRIKVVVLLDQSAVHLDGLLSALQKAETLVVFAHNSSALTGSAHVVFPMSTYAETEGTFSNTHHRVQYFEAAVTTKQNASRMGMKSSRWDRYGASNDRWTQGEKRDCRSGWSIISAIACACGREWNYTSSEDVFEDITKHIAEYRGMSYELLVACGGVTLGNADHATPLVNQYDSHELKPN